MSLLQAVYRVRTEEAEAKAKTGRAFRHDRPASF
jgi:hypothetical protein